MPSGRGELCQSSVMCSCLLCPYLVCFLSLLSVILSVSSRPAVFVSLSMIILCIYSPVCSVLFHLVYSLLPGVPVDVSLALFVYIKYSYFEYILVYVFLVRPSCVHRDNMHSKSIIYNFIYAFEIYNFISIYSFKMHKPGSICIFNNTF